MKGFTGHSVSRAFNVLIICIKFFETDIDKQKKFNSLRMNEQHFERKKLNSFKLHKEKDIFCFFSD